MPSSAAEASGAEFAPATVTRAFGEENRARLLTKYFAASGPVTAATAWQHVYRLLLWIDRTTALAHCYESDKCQPGRPWYARSLAFHAWAAATLGVTPATLGEHIDWLFREAVKDLAGQAFAGRSAAYEQQRKPYAGQHFPEPGEDPELVAIIKEVLGPQLAAGPSEAEYRTLASRIYAHVTQENKRKNLVGEGFEDVLGAVVRQLHPVGLDVRNRPALHSVPGFYPPKGNDKIRKVDLVLIKEDLRTLVSAKWSVRADREEQFHSDFETYNALESKGVSFNYSLITNEFDAARLKAACERRRQNALLFTHVVHINPAGVLAAYGEAAGDSIEAVRAHIASGRLQSLQGWLETIGAS